MEGFLIIYLPVAVLTAINAYLQERDDENPDAAVIAGVKALLWPLLLCEVLVQELAGRLR